jgi:hypothetical protein
MNITYQVYDDDGYISLFVFDDAGRCVCAASGYDALSRGQLAKDLRELRRGADPYGLSGDYPAAAWREFENDRKEFSALIADEKGEYLDRSSKAARWAFGISPSQTGNVVSLRDY